MWSVKHQNDMRAAVVVVEVLLDNVDVFFREGWEEVRTGDIYITPRHPS